MVTYFKFLDSNPGFEDFWSRCCVCFCAEAHRSRHEKEIGVQRDSCVRPGVLCICRAA